MMLTCFLCGGIIVDMPFKRNIPMQISNIERMIITAGREIIDGEIVFTGTYWPLIASLFAKSYHARSATLVLEGGYICDKIPPRVPLLAADCCLASAASFVGDSFNTLGMVLQAGWADVTLLSAANVDRFGNVNTTCIGSYSKPKVRMAGTGGGCDLACLAKKLVIVLEQDRLRFPEKVDFVTSPGYLEGGASRIESGLMPDTGPFKVVTTMGIFGFDPENREIILEGFHENLSIEDMKKSVQWPLKISKDVKEIVPPSQEEISVVRNQVDPTGMFLRQARYAGEKASL